MILDRDEVKQLCERTAFRDDVVRGLSERPKRLPCKYFYDDAGSELFERITQLVEYYPTRTESTIMERSVAAMAAAIGPRAAIIEFGSGSSMKTRTLLDHLEDPVAYVPIDVSGDFLFRTADMLAVEYPRIEVLPLCADFTKPMTLPRFHETARRRIIYFPGSTIGNFTPAEAVTLLQRTARLAGPGGGMLLGADLRKDPAILNRAYDDAEGVTAAFNLNILTRINRELEGDFPLDQFEHRAFFNTAESRVEMHLVSKRDQWVHVGCRSFRFRAGESIHTENSYKYSVNDIGSLAAAGGFDFVQMWTDPAKYFSVSYLTVRSTAG